ncbi:hypothetical protein CYMTET_13349 [Cymbomonas tetramitiformis]|uniref:Uncharacterized protein n=1 Tax=Cymbomonas tetramitiformis TaxID=36881 RepID=A0AAE0LBJ8_9CHLO|nr:hypothetical protein CYMTET_13349 [Cymbomonas tetramitiformis]
MGMLTEEMKHLGVSSEAPLSPLPTSLSPPSLLPSSSPQPSLPSPSPSQPYTPSSSPPRILPRHPPHPSIPSHRHRHRVAIAITIAITIATTITIHTYSSITLAIPPTFYLITHVNPTFPPISLTTQCVLAASMFCGALTSYAISSVTFSAHFTQSTRCAAARAST